MQEIIICEKWYCVRTNDVEIMNCEKLWYMRKNNVRERMTSKKNELQEKMNWDK